MHDSVLKHSFRQRVWILISPGHVATCNQLLAKSGRRGSREPCMSAALLRCLYTEYFKISRERNIRSSSSSGLSKGWVVSQQFGRPCQRLAVTLSSVLGHRRTKSFTRIFCSGVVSVGFWPCRRCLHAGRHPRTIRRLGGLGRFMVPILKAGADDTYSTRKSENLPSRQRSGKASEK